MSNTVSEIDLASAWKMLEAHPDAVLIDVRTAAEWQFVGVPTPPGREAILCEWNAWPGGVRNESFVADVQAQVEPGRPVLLICRSGARSRAAGGALSEAGFASCHNVSAGFEGDLDADGHRGGGWKDSLPWRQQ